MAVALSKGRRQKKGERPCVHGLRKQTTHQQTKLAKKKRTTPPGTPAAASSPHKGSCVGRQLPESKRIERETSFEHTSKGKKEGNELESCSGMNAQLLSCNSSWWLHTRLGSDGVLGKGKYSTFLLLQSKEHWALPKSRPIIHANFNVQVKFCKD